MTRRRADHVVWDCRKNEVRCDRCGQSYRPALPAPVTVFIAMAREFTRTHRECKPHAEPHAPPHA